MADKQAELERVVRAAEIRLEIQVRFDVLDNESLGDILQPDSFPHLHHLLFPRKLNSLQRLQRHLLQPQSALLCWTPRSRLCLYLLTHLLLDLCSWYHGLKRPRLSLRLDYRLYHGLVRKRHNWRISRRIHIHAFRYWLNLLHLLRPSFRQHCLRHHDRHIRLTS